MTAKTLSQYKAAANMPNETRSTLDKVMTEWISKNHKKNINVVKKAMRKINVDNDLVEEHVYDIYIWMYVNYENTLSFAKNDALSKLFNSVAYHHNTFYLLSNEMNRRNIDYKLSYDRTYETGDGFDYAEEIEDKYTNDALNPKLDNNERLEAHRIALSETLQYINDNPNSKIKKALVEMKNECGDKGYKVALHYISTPSYQFLRHNREALNLINTNGYITKFKEICSKLYGKKLLKNSIMNYINI
jgi:predicted solute-binding protein